MAMSPILTWRSALPDFKLGWYATLWYGPRNGPEAAETHTVAVAVFFPGINHPSDAVAIKKTREHLLGVATLLAEPENIVTVENPD